MNNRSWMKSLQLYGNDHAITYQTIATRYLLVMGLLCSTFSLIAQLQINPDRPTGYYELGETARFVVNSQFASGTANYTIHADTRTPNYASGTIQIVAGQPVTIPYTPSDAGVVTCTVNLNGQFGVSSAGIGVYELDALENEPSDFDAFWQNQVNRSDALALNAQVSYFRGSGVSDTYKFSIANIDNRRMHGYLTVPKDGGTFPAMITLPAFGEGANLTQPDETSANILKVISVSLSIHNADPNSIDPNAYEPNDIADRENYYYKQAIIGVKRVIDYLHTRPDFDGQNVILAGVSQGGGLATIVGGLDQRVDLIVESNPALTRHLGPKYGRPASFPYYIWQSRTRVGTPDHETQTASAAKYYDAIYFAKRYKNPALMIIGYQDDVTPPDGSFAVYNQWSDKKILLHSLKTGHNHPAEYWNGRYDVIRRFIPSTQQPQYPNLGYVANAGEDRNVAANSVLNMTGQMVDGYNVLNNLSVRWEQVSGPGNANFSHPTSYNTNVTFSAQGRYVLRFSGDITDKLAGESKYYTLSDQVVVQVGQGGGDDGNGGGDDGNGGGDDGNGGGDGGNGGGDGGNGGGDDGNGGGDGGNGGGETDLVSTNIDFLTFDQWGNIDAQITFSESAVGLSFSDFEIRNGAMIGISGWGQFYFIKVQPLGDVVEIRLPASTVNAINGGKLNAASEWLRIETGNGSNGDNNGGGNGGVQCQNITDGGQVRGNEANCVAFMPVIITNVSEATGGAGEIEYKWQQSAASENGPWTDISGAKNVNYQPPMITQTTWYRRIAKRNNCGDFTGNSNVVVKQVTTPNDSETTAAGTYCDLRADQPWWQWIQKVQVGNFVNYSNKEGYGDFLNKQIELAQGNTYSLELVPGFTWERYDEHWRVWIDFNQDGDFTDAGELLFQGNGQDTQFGTIEIPTDARSGLTRMRVAMRNGSGATACESFTYGEVEDYTVMLKNGGLSSYCDARSDQPWNQWIVQVQFANLNKYSGKEGYADFTNETATLTSGQVFSMTLRPGFSYGTFDMHWQVWIDYNKDGDFMDAGERVVSTNSEQAVVTDVFIPNYAAPGITRMRVAARTGAFAQSCGNIPFGEVEDYNVIIRECANGGNGRQQAVLELTTWRSGRTAELTWITNTEYKNDYFAIERSADGETFTEIERFLSASDAYFAPNTYNFSDAQPIHGQNFYRVKQVYKDGLFRYSDVLELDFDLDVNAFTIFPNPTQSDLFINLPEKAGKSAKLFLINTLGQRVQELQIAEIPSYPIRMPLLDLQHGVYQLYLEVAGEKGKVETVVIGR